MSKRTEKKQVVFCTECGKKIRKIEPDEECYQYNMHPKCYGRIDYLSFDFSVLHPQYDSATGKMKFYPDIADGVNL